MAGNAGQAPNSITAMDKQELRKQIRAAKKAVPFCEKLQRSESIMQRVEELDCFQQAGTVLLYWSMDDEVQTHDFVNRCCCLALTATTYGFASIQVRSASKPGNNSE